MYLKSQSVYKEGDEVRVKQLATKVGLKRELRNNLWSDMYKITKKSLLQMWKFSLKIKRKSLM